MFLVSGSAVGLALAENEGQAELDQAIDAKLSAETIDDLSQMISLAQKALEKGLDKDNTAFAQKLLASAYVQRGGAMADAIFHSNAKEPGWLEQMQRVRLSALADLEEAVQLEPNQAEALYWIGRLHLLPSGDRDRAKEVLDSALKVAGIDNEFRAKVHVARAALFEDRDARLAELSEAVRAAPSDAEYVRNRGLAYAEAGKLAEAVADLEKAIELDPEAASSYEALSLVHATSKDYDRAVEALDKLVERQADSPLIYAQRARLQMLRNKPEAAVADLTKAAELLPDNAGVLLLRAEALQRKGDAAAALADVETVLRQRDDYLPALQMRGLLLAEVGKLDDAVKDLERVADAAQQDPIPRLQLAMLQFSRKKMRTAIDEFTKVLEVDPQSWLALQGRADSYLAIGKQAEALSDYNEGVKLQPQNSSILNNLAWLLATSPEDGLRDGQRAIDLATKACEATEYKQAHILSTLAAGYAEIGDFETAKRWSAKAVELSDEKTRDALKKELESYQGGKPWRELQTETPESADADPDKTSEKPAESPPDPQSSTADKRETSSTPK